MADEFLRASDGDREAAATLLREHLLAGRITMDEFEERLGAVYSAITLGDLGKLMDDLPIQTEQIDQDGPESRKERRRRKGSESKGKKAIAEWQERRDSQAHLLQFARYFRGEPAAPGFMCKPGETVFATVTSAALLEQRRLPGSYQGRSSGVSVPVGFGIRLRGGRSRGHYVPGPEALTDIDVGTLYITNKRVVFQGPKQTRESLFDKTVGISRDDQRGVAVISVSNRQRPMVIRYGPRVTSDVAIRMELALAHFHGNLPTLIERLEHGLAEIDRNRPESAGSASALLPVSASDGPSRRMTGVSEKSRTLGIDAEFLSGLRVSGESQ
jgi:hypothetical protein